MTRAEINNRREELMGDINALGYSHPMPTLEATRAYNARLAALHAELAALPQPSTQGTGESAGVVALTRDGFLGDPWKAPPREERIDPDADHPLLRHYGDALR